MAFRTNSATRRGHPLVVAVWSPTSRTRRSLAGGGWREVRAPLVWACALSLSSATVSTVKTREGRQEGVALVPNVTASLEVPSWCLLPPRLPELRQGEAFSLGACPGPSGTLSEKGGEQRPAWKTPCVPLCPQLVGKLQELGPAWCQREEQVLDACQLVLAIPLPPPFPLPSVTSLPTAPLSPGCSYGLVWASDAQRALQGVLGQGAKGL